MSHSPNGGLEETVPALNGQFTQSETDLDLVAASLMPDVTRDILDLHNEQGDWSTTSTAWVDGRHADRLTTEGTRRHFNAIKPRLQEAGGGLPSLKHLPEILDACRKDRDRNQVLYCYLVAEDAVFRYVLHEYLRQLAKQRIDRLDFSDEVVVEYLEEFRHADGEPLDAAESTKSRWATNFRSVLRSIGVIQGQQATAGDVPNVGDIPLEIAAYWSWHKHGDEWLTDPVGWRYLFQPQSFWQPQSQRLAKSTRWSSHESHGRLWYEPVEDFYAALAGDAE